MNTKGVRFISKNKAVINIKRHADIMEDALDRIKVKEAMQTGEFISWDEVEKKINQKLGVRAIHNTTNKASRKSSFKSK